MFLIFNLPSEWSQVAAASLCLRSGAKMQKHFRHQAALHSSSTWLLYCKCDPITRLNAATYVSYDSSNEEGLHWCTLATINLFCLKLHNVFEESTRSLSRRRKWPSTKWSPEPRRLSGTRFLLCCRGSNEHFSEERGRIWKNRSIQQHNVAKVLLPPLPHENKWDDGCEIICDTQNLFSNPTRYLTNSPSEN